MITNSFYQAVLLACTLLPLSKATDLGGEAVVDVSQVKKIPNGQAGGILYGIPNDPAYSPDKAPTIPSDLQQLFATHSLLLSLSSYVKVGSLDWQIFDPVYERIFTLYQENDLIKVIDGGQQYELQNYQFWKISYYPLYERWLFINRKANREHFNLIIVRGKQQC